MSSFRIDLIDPTTSLIVGDFPITTTTKVNRRQKLDAAGLWSFDVSVADVALADVEGKHFDIYWYHDGSTYYLGRCIYLDHVISGQRKAEIKAVGLLDDLGRQTVLQRDFDGATDDVNDVLAELVPLRSGWTLGSVDTITTAAPLSYWFENVLDSVALLAETFDKHFREGTTVKTIDFGAFGISSGVLALGGDNQEPGAGLANENQCFINDLTVSYKRSEVVNQLIPFGGAIGVATIDLSEVTVETVGYEVQSAALPGTGSYYYIKDQDSIDANGLTERRFLRKDLRPILNSQAAREFSANILYEAALASLLNLKDRQIVYTLSTTLWIPGQVKVGDKINVRYHGFVETSAGALDWLEIDDDANPGQGKAFYVLELAEVFGDSISASLTINENAVAEESDTDRLASTIRSFEQSSIVVQPTISVYTVGPYVKRVDTSTDAVYSFRLGNETLDLVYAKLKLVGEPLKSSVTAAATDGHTHDLPDHAHKITVFDAAAGNGLTASTTGTGDSFRHDNGGAGDVDILTQTGLGSPTTVPNDDHTHTMTYGIFEDAVRPDTLLIKVNGSTVASGISLTGPDYDYELDITSDILAAVTLQADHVILVECGSNRGDLVFQLQILSVIQPIAVT